MKLNGKKMPSEPWNVYGYNSWGEFVGKENIDFITLSEDKKIAISLKLQSQKEWYRYWRLNKRPIDVPSTPSCAYKDKGWISWPDFFGTKNFKKCRMDDVYTCKEDN